LTAAALAGCAVDPTYTAPADGSLADLTIQAQLGSAEVAVCGGGQSGGRLGYIDDEATIKRNLDLPWNKRVSSLSTKVQAGHEARLSGRESIVTSPGSSSVCAVDMSFAPQANAQYTAVWSSTGRTCRISIYRLVSESGTAKLIPEPSARAAPTGDCGA